MESIHLFFRRQQLNRTGTAKGLMMTDRTVSPILLTQRDTLQKASYEINCEQSPLSEKKFYLNAEQDDPSLMRRRLAYCFFHQLGVASQDASYIFLIINGQREGIYLKIDALDTNLRLPKGAIYEVKDTDPRVPLSVFKHEASIENRQRTAYLREFLTLICTAEDEEFAERIKMYLDVKLFFLWLIGSVCTRQAFYYGFSLNEAGRFHITPMETKALAAYRFTEEDPLLTNGRTLASRLLSIPAFRAQYHTLMKNVLSREFTIDRLSPFIRDWHFDICQRAGDDPHIKKSTLQLEKEQANILREIEERQDFLQVHLARL